MRHALPGSACAVYSLRVAGCAVGPTRRIGRDVHRRPSPAIHPVRSAARRAATDRLLRRQLAREDYAHLHVLRTVRSIGYLPLLRDQELAGAFEIVSFTEEITEDTLRSVEGIAGLAVAALTSAEQFEEQRQNLLDSIHRLTQLYDLEKSLNETLDFEPLLELIPVKVAAMLPCQAIHLWMFDGGKLGWFPHGAKTRQQRSGPSKTRAKDTSAIWRKKARRC